MIISSKCPPRQISIHALHEESDGGQYSVKSLTNTFQSTLSMRRATFNPEREPVTVAISIHALHEESDPMITGADSIMAFQSTLSMRRATIRIV